MIKSIFERCDFDNCVYFKFENVSNPIYLLLYMDYLFIACKCKIEIKYLKIKLSDEFEKNDLGPSRMILMMKILRKYGSLFLSKFLIRKGFEKIFYE